MEDKRIGNRFEIAVESPNREREKTKKLEKLAVLYHYFVVFFVSCPVTVFFIRGQSAQRSKTIDQESRRQSNQENNNADNGG